MILKYGWAWRRGEVQGKKGRLAAIKDFGPLMMELVDLLSSLQPFCAAFYLKVGIRNGI